MTIRYDLSSLRTLSSGGAKVPRACRLLFARERERERERERDRDRERERERERERPGQGQRERKTDRQKDRQRRNQASSHLTTVRSRQATWRSCSQNCLTWYPCRWVHLSFCLFVCMCVSLCLSVSLSFSFSRYPYHSLSLLFLVSRADVCVFISVRCVALTHARATA
jgi:Flp pilus assembly protein TadB